MNYQFLHQALNAAQEVANMLGDRTLIFKPRNRDSYEVVRWNMRDFENQNYVGECSPVSWN